MAFSLSDNGSDPINQKKLIKLVATTIQGEAVVAGQAKGKRRKERVKHSYHKPGLDAEVESWYGGAQKKSYADRSLRQRVEAVLAEFSKQLQSCIQNVLQGGELQYTWQRDQLCAETRLVLEQFEQNEIFADEKDENHIYFLMAARETFEEVARQIGRLDLSTDEDPPSAVSERLKAIAALQDPNAPAPGETGPFLLDKTWTSQDLADLLHDCMIVDSNFTISNAAFTYFDRDAVGKPPFNDCIRIIVSLEKALKRLPRTIDGDSVDTESALDAYLASVSETITHSLESIAVEKSLQSEDMIWLVEALGELEEDIHKAHGKERVVLKAQVPHVTDTPMPPKDESPEEWKEPRFRRLSFQRVGATLAQREMGLWIANILHNSNPPIIEEHDHINSVNFQVIQICNDGLDEAVTTMADAAAATKNIEDAKSAGKRHLRRKVLVDVHKFLDQEDWSSDLPHPDYHGICTEFVLHCNTCIDEISMEQLIASEADQDVPRLSTAELTMPSKTAYLTSVGSADTPRNLTDVEQEMFEKNVRSWAPSNDSRIPQSPSRRTEDFWVSTLNDIFHGGQTVVTSEVLANALPSIIEAIQTERDRVFEPRHIDNCRNYVINTWKQEVAQAYVRGLMQLLREQNEGENIRTLRVGSGDEEIVCVTSDELNIRILEQVCNIVEEGCERLLSRLTPVWDEAMPTDKRDAMQLVFVTNLELSFSFIVSTIVQCLSEESGMEELMGLDSKIIKAIQTTELPENLCIDIAESIRRPRTIDDEVGMFQVGEAIQEDVLGIRGLQPFATFDKNIPLLEMERVQLYDFISTKINEGLSTVEQVMSYLTDTDGMLRFFVDGFNDDLHAGYDFRKQNGRILVEAREIAQELLLPAEERRGAVTSLIETECFDTAIIGRQSNARQRIHLMGAVEQMYGGECTIELDKEARKDPLSYSARQRVLEHLFYDLQENCRPDVTHDSVDHIDIRQDIMPILEKETILVDERIDALLEQGLPLETDLKNIFEAVRSFIYGGRQIWHHRDLENFIYLRFRERSFTRREVPITKTLFHAARKAESFFAYTSPNWSQEFDIIQSALAPALSAPEKWVTEREVNHVLSRILDEVYLNNKIAIPHAYKVRQSILDFFDPSNEQSDLAEFDPFNKKAGREHVIPECSRQFSDDCKKEDEYLQTLLPAAVTAVRAEPILEDKDVIPMIVDGSAQFNGVPDSGLLAAVVDHVYPNGADAVYKMQDLEEYIIRSVERCVATIPVEEPPIQDPTDDGESAENIAESVDHIQNVYTTHLFGRLSTILREELLQNGIPTAPIVGGEAQDFALLTNDQNLGVRHCAGFVNVVSQVIDTVISTQAAESGNTTNALQDLFGEDQSSASSQIISSVEHQLRAAGVCNLHPQVFQSLYKNPPHIILTSIEAASEDLEASLHTLIAQQLLHGRERSEQIDLTTQERSLIKKNLVFHGYITLQEPVEVADVVERIFADTNGGEQWSLQINESFHAGLAFREPEFVLDAIQELLAAHNIMCKERHEKRERQPIVHEKRANAILSWVDGWPEVKQVDESFLAQVEAHTRLIRRYIELEEKCLTMDQVQRSILFLEDIRSMHIVEVRLPKTNRSNGNTPVPKLFWKNGDELSDLMLRHLIGSPNYTLQADQLGAQTYAAHRRASLIDMDIAACQKRLADFDKLQSALAVAAADLEDQNTAIEQAEHTVEAADSSELIPAIRNGDLEGQLSALAQVLQTIEPIVSMIRSLEVNLAKLAEKELVEVEGEDIVKELQSGENDPAVLDKAKNDLELIRLDYEDTQRLVDSQRAFLPDEEHWISVQEQYDHLKELVDRCYGSNVTLDLLTRTGVEPSTDDTVFKNGSAHIEAERFCLSVEYQIKKRELIHLEQERDHLEVVTIGDLHRQLGEENALKERLALATGLLEEIRDHIAAINNITYRTLDGVSTEWKHLPKPEQSDA